MTSVSMFEAKTNLSKYVSAVSGGKEPFIVIVRNNRPVAKLVPFDSNVGARLGIAKGLIPRMSSLEEFNNINIEDDFYGADGLL